jgi:hypothetical protein
MMTDVPEQNFGGLEASNVLTLLGTSYWTNEELNQFMETSFIFPSSIIIINKIEPLIIECFLTKMNMKIIFIFGNI